MKTSELKKLIGKRIRWKANYDPNRGSYSPRSGILEEVQGRNLKVDNDWRWLPDMMDIEEVKEKYDERDYRG